MTSASARNTVPRGASVKLWHGVGIVIGLAVLACLWHGLFLAGPRRGLPEELTPEAAAGFNVLIITLDTTRADHLGCYGYRPAQTPVLDALATEGIRFADAVTVAPLTLPAHTTILTGLNPPNHGVRNNGEYRLDEDHVTLAEVLHGQGYETVAFVSAFVLAAQFGLNQGFEIYDDKVEVGQSRPFVQNIHERSATSVTDATIRWLDGRDPQRPFFCWVHYFDPHLPYEPPTPFSERFRDRLYDGEIAYMDSQIGRLLQALKVADLRESTAVIVVGDHGEGLGDHGESDHGVLVYESTMHVPLIVSCPGLFRGPLLVDNAVVSATDIFPTVLELLGVKVPLQCDGLSLLSAGADPGRMVHLESIAPYMNGWSPLYGLRRHSDKYILAPRPEYYDLRSDPAELNNLYERVSSSQLLARDALVAELAAQLAAWPSIEGIASSAQMMDDETRRRLESLGYVGSMSSASSGEQMPDPKDMMPAAQAADRANALAASGKYEEALVAIKEAVSLAPRYHDALRTMGNLYLLLRRPEEAEEAFRAIVASDPSSQAYVILAQVAAMGGRHDEAVTLLDQAAQLNSRDGRILIIKGGVLAQQGHLDEAIAAYELAMEIDPVHSVRLAQPRIAILKERLQAESAP